MNREHQPHTERSTRSAGSSFPPPPPISPEDQETPAVTAWGDRPSVYLNYYLNGNKERERERDWCDLHALGNEFGNGQLRNPIVLETLKHLDIQIQVVGVQI